ncbi:hypothetical protein [Microbulbifer pacificus]|uniref:Uncharacterized protein n=1 Tax=Microbulbifer pacificus TaxID=407164 RepID=A0AAU0MXX6_9GAMM|nr:hypothetical protein [Microbulbifer pacificus]WOX05055.1 hypothetical protein R5R33_15100 [Microbulbifer pacificus]
MENSGSIKILSVIYMIFFGAFTIAALLNTNIQGYQLEAIYDVWVPLAFFVISFGIFRMTKWGRLLGYPVSLMLLPGVPIGTIFGGFMIWQLTKYRQGFTRWL